MSNEVEWIRRITSEMERWATESAQSLLGGHPDAFWVPPVDVYETQDTVVVKISAAGVRRENLNLTLTADNRHLMIQGVREDDLEARRQAVRYHQLEIYTGPFERLVSLPPVSGFEMEKLNAVSRDGFIIVTLPKLPVDQAGPRTVPIDQE